MTGHALSVLSGGLYYQWCVIHGRERELAEIHALLADARLGHGRALVIRGEAGIGKSTLLHAAIGADMEILSYTGVESEVELGFAGLQSLLAPLGMAEFPEPLWAALGQGGTAASDLVVYTAVLAVLSQAAERRPLLVVVDDAHCVDRASMAAILFVARRLRNTSIALLLGVREPCTVDTADLPQLKLAGLTADAAGRVLADLRLSSEARERLVEATGGNPLALTELKHVPDPASVVETALITGTVPLPERLTAIFLAQVRSLSARARELLLIAAAEDAGDLDLVLAVARRRGLPDSALADAESADLIVVAGRDLRFRHPLIRSAVYNAATAPRRRAVHAAIAAQLSKTDSQTRWHRALATVGADENLANELELDARAIAERGGLAATASAMRRAALLSDTGIGRTRRTVAAAYAAWKSGQPEQARSLIDETRGQPVDQATRTMLAQLNGMVDLYGGDQLTAYTNLLRGAESVTDHAPEEAAYTLFMACEAAFHANRLDDAVRTAASIAGLNCGPAYHEYGTWLVESLVDDAKDGGLDPFHLAESAPEDFRRSLAHRWVLPMAIAWHGADPRSARDFARTACADIRANGMLAILAVVLPWLAEVEYRIGQYEDAISHAEEAVRAAWDSGYHARVADCLALLALCAAARGDASDCRTYAEQTLAAALPLHNHLAAGHATLALGTLALAEGDHAAALDRLSRLDAAGSPVAHGHVARVAVADTVEAYIRAGLREPAEQAVRGFEPWARNGPGWARALLQRSYALLVDDDNANKHFQLALTAPDSEARPFEHARTALLYGQWLRRNRRSADARAQLRQAAELFDSLGATRWAAVAAGELRASGASAVRHGNDTAALLTAQELQVAQLAASGLSNKEIGARLFVSPRTVSYHLYKIFPKLGIATRAQLRDLVLEKQSI